VEAVFEHVKGVKDAVSGYAGGNALTAHYPIVGSGRTGHAESVRVVYDPARVSYGQLLKVYFSVAHDPTQLNRQSPDVGPQYRSEIFTTSAEQRKIADAYIAQLTAAKAFAKPIVTKVEPLVKFYPAEAYHQDYLRLHPDEPYIVYNDAPKLVHLKQLFPALYRGG
jgi:peptide-methionine (S)-S-oxide reductase